MADEANEAPAEPPAPAATPAPPVAVKPAGADPKKEWAAAVVVMIVFGAIIGGFYWYIRH